MTALGTLFTRSTGLENPSQPLSSAGLAEWLTGNKAAGVAVNEPRVLGLPAYYRAVAVTAGTLAALPLKVYRNDSRERVTARTALDNPNPRQTPFEFWQTIYVNAIAWGNGYARKLRDGAGLVRETWPIHPGRVRVEEVDPTEADPAGKLFLVRDRYGVEHRYSGYEIMHLPYLSPDGVQGVRPLHLFRQSLGIAISGDDYTAQFLANGSRVSGVLTTEKDLDDSAATRLKRRWKEKTSGPENAGEIAVLDRGAKFEAISIPPADAQLLESRKWSVTEIARMVGTPPHLIGDVSGSTSWGTGIEEQVLGWVKFTLQSWISLSEQRITREVLPGGWSAGTWYAEYALEGLLRGDSKTRAEFYRTMTQNGLMVRNEGRRFENLEPLEGGDVPLLPAGVLPAPVAEHKALIEALGGLVRAGFDPAAACEALGLDPIAHTGLVPVTVTVGEQLTDTTPSSEGGDDAGSNVDT